MIGWENNQGAYFVQKLQEQIDNAVGDISDNTTDISGIKSDIGKMSDLTTTADTLVGAVNEVDADTGNALSSIGNMSDLNTTANTLVGAVNEVNKIINCGTIINQSLVLNVSNNARYLLFSIATSTQRSGMWIGYSGTNGANYLVPVITAGTDLSVDATVNNQITITNANQSSSATICVIEISGSITVGN